MGIREELSDVIANAPAIDAWSASEPDDVADAILERFGVVELPEPTCSTGVNTVWIDSLNVVILPAGRISTSGRVLTADEARRSAAVLLAAAKYTEENA